MIKLSDQIPTILKGQFKKSISDQIEKMSLGKKEIASELLKDPAFVRVSFITWLDPEAYELRLKIYDQASLIEDRDHLTKLFLKDKRSSAKVAVAALIHDLDRCYSVDQRKLHGAKESVRKLRKVYSEKVLEKLDQGIFWSDCFPVFTKERKVDEKAVHYDFHLYSMPKNKQEFENLFDLTAIWSIQDAHLNKEDLDLFERKEGQKDILIRIFDPEGKILNYKGMPFSAFAKEKFRPLVRAAAREYDYRMAKEYPHSQKIKHSSAETEDLMYKTWFESILNYKKGKESIPTYFKRNLYDFFFGEDKIEMIDYELAERRNHFIDDFTTRFIEGINLKDEIDEIIALNFDRKLREIQEILKTENHDISLSTILRKKNKMRKPLQNQLKMAKVIADRARETIPIIPEFDEKEYSKA